jgi:DNA helicase HerA-like ATPase
MILGRIVGKVNTREFGFKVEDNAKIFDYIQVFHKDYDYVLGQIVEIEKSNSETLARCKIIGALDQDKVIFPRTPLDPGTEVLIAEDSFIQKVIRLNEDIKGAFVGFLDGKKIPIYLDLNNLLTKHLAVLAKSGSGKSYAVGVLLEEIMDKNIPLLVIDPHGEYTSMQFPNTDPSLEEFGLKPKSYNLEIYGDKELGLRSIKLNDSFNAKDILQIFPVKLSANQQNLLYAAVRNKKQFSLENLKQLIDLEENNAKFSLINTLEYLQSLDIFSEVNYQSMFKPGTATIINLKGISPEIQEIIVFKLLNDLFDLRKKDLIAPFFSVIEEAHQYCPERSFGETKASKVIRNIASEGRKFGMGLAIVSQRPARVDKSVLSQCSTQIILKVTNPNDVKAVSNSIEGIDSYTEKEIINLPIGTAMVTGIVDVPLLVKIRTRKSKHGGDAVEIFTKEKSENLDFLPVINSNLTEKDIRIMYDNVRAIKTRLRPALFIEGEKDDKELNLIFDLVDSSLVSHEKKKVPDIRRLPREDISLLRHLYKKNKASIADLKALGFDQSLNRLINSSLIINKNSQITLSSEYLFKSISTMNTSRKISYKTVSYEEKIKPKIKKEDAIELLGNIIDIKTIKECYIIELYPEFN